MATETVTSTTRAAPFIEAAGKTYLDEQLFTCKVSYFEPNVKNTYSIIQHI